MIPTSALWDPNLFRKSLKVIGIQIPSDRTGGYLRTIGPHLLKQRNLKPVQSPTETTRLLYLDPVAMPTVQSVMDKEDLAALIRADTAEVKEHNLDLTYESFHLEEALRMVIPADVQDIPSAFETIGHVAHLNLKPWVLPYKHIIGQMIIDKTHGIRTVVNKTETIQNQFRVFPMEVLAGEDDLDVEVSESGCKFHFNYGRVYWNSRLQAEHSRLVKSIMKRTSHPVVADAFAGVGPFSIPLAKTTRSTVYANDLNPESFQCLVANAKLNKVSPNKHIESNLDGREFLVDLVRSKCIRPTDIIMNLPASATDFLDVFKGLYLESDTEAQLPMVHCYTFAEEDNAEATILARVEAMIGTKVISSAIHNVRNIAPKKHMFCISFNLPTTIERANASADSAMEVPPSAKRAKLL